MPKKNSNEPAPANGGSAERTLALLALLADAGRPMSLAQLAEGLSLPKATVHRLCTLLLQGGYIAKDLGEREFVVGRALLKLSFDTLNHGTLRGSRHEVLSRLVEQVNETCNFTTLDGASVLYLDRVEAPWPWRLKLEIGTHVPLHCTASGKLFLALMPEDQREALLASLSLQKMTERTLTTAKALRARCEQIAEAGYSLDEGEFIDGLTAIAVPVRDGEGVVRAALATHAPVSRLPKAKALAHLPALRAAAKRMQALL